MDLLKAQLDRIQQQLSGLSATQKMLAGCLVAIMVMTLLWWGRYAAQAERVAVIEQDFDERQLSRVTSLLRAEGIDAKVVGRRVFVPSEQQDLAISHLFEEQLMPEHTADAFEEMFKKSNVFDTAARTEQMFTVAKTRYVQEIIRSFEGVASAAVLMDTSEKRGFARNQPPVASITIQMKPGHPATRQLAEAAARTLAGVKSGLEVSKINVTIDKRVFRLDEEDGLAIDSEKFAEKRRMEQAYEEEVREQLGQIEGAIVHVSVDVDHTSRLEEAHKVDPKEVVVAPLSEKSTSEKTSEGGSSAAAEPGAVANGALALGDSEGASAGGAGRSTEREDAETRNFVDASTTKSTVRTPAGRETIRSIGISLPRSHFAKLYKLANKSASEPDETALIAYSAPHRETLKQHIRGTFGLSDKVSISVEEYVDASAMLMAAASTDVSTAAAAATPASSMFSGLLNSHARELSVGALAVASLFMVMMMVRRGATVPVASGPLASVETPHLMAGAPLAGEAGEGDSLLDGMELDDDAVRTQQMLSQVQTLVKEDPDAAATLVQRWLNRT